MHAIKVLIIEDDADVRSGIRRFLEAHDLEVDEAVNCQEARHIFAIARPDVAVIDYKLPDGTALDLLPELKALDPDAQLLVLTGHASIDLAVNAMREGADHFLTKPVELPALLVLLQRLTETHRIRQKQRAGKSKQERTVINPFVGQSPAIQALAETAMKVARSESPVLIHGETGTGKGVLAEWLHRAGRRADEPFVDLNCAGLTREFLETELFGHERGAFTGAVASKTGLLDVAHRGSIFLDEIGDISVEVQPKLLKVLEEQKFRRMGSTSDRRVDVRLIAASHHDLASLVQRAEFRSDLYYRLNTIPITVPPLKDRRGDIPVLARHLLDELTHDLGRKAVVLTDSALSALADYVWPGNIRELRNVLERAVLLSGGDLIEQDDLRFDPAVAGDATDEDASLTLEEVAERHILRVLRKEHGRVAAAAKVLGVPRSTLYQKLKKYGIDPTEL